MKIKPLNWIVLTVVCGWAMSAHAALYQTDFTTGFANCGDGPEGNATGCADTRVITGLTDSTVTDVKVWLNISANGELYVYLAHSNKFFPSFTRNGWMGSHPFSNVDGTGDVNPSHQEISTVPEPIHLALGIFGSLCATVGGARFWRRYKRTTALYP
jgi:hypothetical protein